MTSIYPFTLGSAIVVLMQNVALAATPNLVPVEMLHTMPDLEVADVLAYLKTIK